MKKLAIALLLTACTDSSGATRALKSQGFTDITITGWSPLSCGKDDTTSTGFRAKNARGDTVEGVVCCGLVFKNCTVRF
jgi:hypothetical protein